MTAAVRRSLYRVVPKRLCAAVAVGAGVVVVGAGPAGAHGVGARADLPLPVWLFAYAAAIALVISFVALGMLWPSPRLARWATGRVVPGGALPGVALDAIVAVGAGVMLVATLLATLVGPDDAGQNLAPTALYVAFWVGGQVLAAVVGDVWRRGNPLWWAARALGGRLGRSPETDTARGVWASHWPAAGGLLAFVWLELAYHDSTSITAIAVFLFTYVGLVLVGAAFFGPAWVRTGDGFAVLFSLLAALSPLGRDEVGRLRLRVPGTGLAHVSTRPGTVAVVLVLLGGTTFDGVERTAWWADVVGVREGWAATTVHTVGLVTTIGVVSVVYRSAVYAVARCGGDEQGDGPVRRWVPSLVPIVLGYAVAHYFSLLVFEGQSFLSLLSDPFGRGWDLFGTAANSVDYRAVTPTQIAYVQVGAIVLGHVLGVVAAHDKAVDRYPGRLAARSQYPLLAAMVAYTVFGLVLLLNA